MDSAVIKNSIYRHIRAYNKHLTMEYLKTLSNEELLNNCSPLYREGYARLLYRNAELEAEKANQYGKMSMNE